MSILGTCSDGKRVSVDVDSLVKSRLLLQANSGGGKSWALRRLLERTHGKVQQLVLDPEGEFYTLREKFDYVLAGKGGDCPAEVRSADLLARRLLELGCSAIIDIQDLSPADRRRFVARFVGALMDAPRKLWHPALIVVDEAHTFAPQSGSAESGDAIARLMSAGRKRGFCGVLATQRISKLHKDVAAEANNMLIGRARQDVDRKRAAEELGFASKDDAMGLRALAPGEFFAFGPAFNFDGVERIQVGDVKSSHPEGGAGAPPVSPPRARVQSLLGELADLPAEAEEEARTSEALREKVRELERELREALRAVPRVSEAEIDEIREKARAEAQTHADQVIEEIRATARQATRVAGESGAAIAEAARSLGELCNVAAPELAPPKLVTTQAPSPPPRRTPAKSTASVEGVDGPMQRILDAVAWYEGGGIPGPYSKVQVAFLSRYKPKGGSFNNALGRCRSAGLIEYPSPGMVSLTDSGRAAAVWSDERLTPAVIQSRVVEMVDGPMRRILAPLIAAYPGELTKEVVADDAGYQAGGGSFNNAMGRLRTLGVIDYPSPGRVVALPVLFPGAAHG